TSAPWRSHPIRCGRAAAHPTLQRAPRMAACGRGRLRCQERAEAARRMLQRFLVGVLTQRVVTRLCAIAHRSLEVPALFEVHGQLAGNLARTGPIATFETLPHAHVKTDTLSYRHARVEGVLIQGVNEGVLA